MDNNTTVLGIPLSRAPGLRAAGSRLMIVLLLASVVPGGAVAADAPLLPEAARAGTLLPAGGDGRTGPAAPAELLIPPVIERPLSVDEGERVRVARFVLKGAADHPEYGLHVAELEALLEALRIKAQGLDKLDARGFSREDVELGMGFLGQLLERPGDSAGSDDLEALESVLARLRENRRRRGLTVGQLQQIANEVTQRYREAGLILARAFIPAQTVQDGVVVVQVLEGRLGRVVAEGNQRYRNSVLEAPFSHLVDRPVHKSEIESGILQVADYPGLAVFGVFRPGDYVGTTKLVLKVQDEQAWNYSLRGDNYGSPFTGEYRLRADLSINNPTGAADKFSANLTKNFKPSNGLFGVLRYERPLGTPVWRGGVNYARYRFDLGGDLRELGISGTTEEGGLSLRRVFQRSRARNSYGLLELTRKSARIDDPVNKTDDLTVANVEYGFDFLDRRFGGFNTARLQWQHGFGGLLGAMDSTDAADASRRGGSGVNAGGRFDKWAVRIQRLQRLALGQSLLLDLQAQYSDDLLTSLEQFSIGGPNSVRAYSVSEFLRDKAYFASVEWIAKAPGFASRPAFRGRSWGEIMSVSVFADFGGGWLNDPTASDLPYVAIGGAGVGLRFNLPPWSSRLQIARPFTDEEAGNGRATQYYFELGYAQ
ncbi:MAG TPA: ShlB/FhaC/HecB family hemolysin secretion/activation protein [Gammaproteobacteria bacterium]|nr:ShlB/FhaC/HecB family hemolysin secretion/activation protein [Gammaproteobacteria bacterium]